MTMLTPRQIIHRTKIFVKSLFAEKGVVGPHLSKRIWDNQFAEGFWDRLADNDQEEHYSHIIHLYKKHSNGGTILDVGCGAGLLYKYFEQLKGFNDENYLGIDISEVAILEARDKYPYGNFKLIDYQTERINEKYDVVIFNETLYYFNHAGKTIQYCLHTNVADGGKIIISMCDYVRHDKIWKALEKKYSVLDTTNCSNKTGVAWTVKIIN